MEEGRLREEDEDEENRALEDVDVDETVEDALQLLKHEEGRDGVVLLVREEEVVDEDGRAGEAPEGEVVLGAGQGVLRVAEREGETEGSEGLGDQVEREEVVSHGLDVGAAEETEGEDNAEEESECEPEVEDGGAPEEGVGGCDLVTSEEEEVVAERGRR